MKHFYPLLAGLIFLGFSGSGLASERDQLQLIAHEAGVSINDVRMVLGGRTTFSQYRTAYDRKEVRVRAALARLAAADTHQQDPKLVAKAK